MAIPAAAVWEARANASNSGLQGGFFDGTGGSTDYSQQDTAQLSLTDIATDVAGTTLTSATGGFTAAMTGNGIYLTGGGATAGWYRLAYTNSTTATIDRSAGASKTGVTGRVGGATIFADAPMEAVAAGNTVYMKADGTHTLSGAISISATAITARVKLVGYNTTRDDNPSGANQPLVSQGANAVGLGDGWHIRHVRFTGTATSVYYSSYGSIYDCYVENTSASAGRLAINLSTQSGMAVLACEAVSTNSIAIASTSTTTVIGCYAHDSVTGYQCNGPVIRCIADTCTTGVTPSSSAAQANVFGTIFYNCTTGLDCNSGNGVSAVNCIFNACTTGFGSAASEAGYHTSQHNDYYGNTTDVSNVEKGFSNLALDPQFTDAAGGNFTIGNTALRAAGIPGVIRGATSTTNYEDVGLQQLVSGGSGGTRAYGGVL